MSFCQACCGLSNSYQQIDEMIVLEQYQDDGSLRFIDMPDGSADGPSQKRAEKHRKRVAPVIGIP